VFTIRIDRGRVRREVYACARYFVGFDPDGQARVTMVGVSDGMGGQRPDPVEMTVGLPDCAFVMNSRGITCDVVRAQRPAAAEIKAVG